MLNTLTIFGATYLIFAEALLAIPVLAYYLYQRSPFTILRWTATVCIMLAVAFLASRVGAALYNDPRPFVLGHFHPLIAHAADNGFPSDHSLVAAAIVAMVALLHRLWAVFFAVSAALVEWARVGAGVHHPVDILGSDAFIALGFIAGILLAPIVASRVLPFIPPPLLRLVARQDVAA